MSQTKERQGNKYHSNTEEPWDQLWGECLVIGRVCESSDNKGQRLDQKVVTK